MTRLTDEQIARAGRICTRDDSDTDDLIELTSLVLPMLVEIRQSRADALTGFDRMVVEVWRDRLEADETVDRHFIALLDRLLAKGAV